MWKIKEPVRDESVWMTIVGIVCGLVYVVMKFGFRKQANKYIFGTASIFEYMAIVCLFVKLIILKQEMPEHGIRITKKIDLSNRSEAVPEQGPTYW